GNLWAHVVASPGASDETRRAELRVFDADGKLVAELGDIRLKRAAQGAIDRLGNHPLAESLYGIAWRELPAAVRRDLRLSASSMAAAARSAADGLRSAAGLAAFDDCLPRLDGFCAGFIVRALRELGWSPDAGQRIAGAALVRKLAV